MKAEISLLTGGDSDELPPSVVNRDELILADTSNRPAASVFGCVSNEKDGVESDGGASVYGT